MSSKLRTLTICFCFSIFIGGIDPTISAALQGFAPQPMRLAVSAAKNTVPVGGKGQLTITFLDTRYHPTANDVRRVIEIRPETTPSTGEVKLPQSIEAMPGQWELTVEFLALKTGRVIIRATSKGLATASVLLKVQPRVSSSRSPMPEAWAADAPRLEIVPTASGGVPANGISRIGFYIAMDRPSPSETRVRIESHPSCVLLYEGANTRPNEGTLIIVLPPNEENSLEVKARAYQAGGVTISAQALPDGQRTEGSLRFDAPVPTSLSFEEDPLSIPASAAGVPLMVHVADQDSIRMGQFQGSWNVTVSPSGNAEAVHIQPGTFQLSPQSPARAVFLSVANLPYTEELQIYALTDNGSLRGAMKRLGFQSVVGGLKVILPPEINSNVPTEVKALFLNKDLKQEASADFQRRVTFLSDRGKFTPDSVLVENGENHATSMFVARETGQKAEIRISTRGVEVATVEVLIVMALWLLVLIAMGSGAVGGLARFFYYHEESWDIWPKKAAKGWNPGLVGNAAFCGVFGVVALLMGRYGLVQPLDPQHNYSLSVNLVYTPAGGFLWGIAGGFAGIGVLHLLADKLGLADALQRRAKQKPNPVPVSDG